MGSSNSDEKIAKKYFYSDIGKSALVNKLDITDQKELEEAEAYFVELAITNGLTPALCHKCDIAPPIHKHLQIILCAFVLSHWAIMFELFWIKHNIIGTNRQN